MARSILTRRPDSGLGNIKRGITDPRRSIDWILLSAVGLLTIIGFFMIYSATRPRMIDNGLDPFQFVQRQIVFVMIALILMGVVMWMDYVQLRGSAELLYAATIVLLILVYLLGAVKGGAKLSFDIGPIAIQPSELSKVSTLLFLCGYLANEELEELPWERFIQSLVIVGVPFALVLIQPDLGSASVVVASAMGVLLVAGARTRYIIGVTALTVVSAAAATVTGLVKKYQISRITGFLDPNPNSESEAVRNLVNQVNQAKRAVASGGFFGKGYLNGPSTNGRFIPVQSTDFVFSAVGEQFGMLGALVVLGLFGVVLYRIYRIARLSVDKLGVLICTGVFTMILWQAFQNIGMTLGIMPVSGVPLPFVSYGGSHMVAFALMIGLVQSVHMRRFR